MLLERAPSRVGDVNFPIKYNTREEGDFAAINRCAYSVYNLHAYMCEQSFNSDKILRHPGKFSAASLCLRVVLSILKFSSDSFDILSGVKIQQLRRPVFYRPTYPICSGIDRRCIHSSPSAWRLQWLCIWPYNFYFMLPRTSVNLAF
jgi:hypothetical protein